MQNKVHLGFEIKQDTCTNIINKIGVQRKKNNQGIIFNFLKMKDVKLML